MNALCTIQSRLNAPKGQTNTFGKYKYRSLEDVLAALKPLLKETESTLVISDTIEMIGDRFYVKATATLTSGKDSWLATAFARESDGKKGMDDSQLTGSCSSYARKYCLNGLFAIDDTKDADSMDNSVKATKPAVVKPLYDAAQFDVNYGVWLNLIREKKHTQGDIIKLISKQYALTDEQIKIIKGIK